MPDPGDASIHDLTAQILAFREARDWAQFHGLKDEVLSLLSEAGELAEHFRWYEGERLQVHVQGRKEDVGDELADVLYWTLLLAHDVGVDLADAFERKMVKNERKYPVGAARGRADKYTDL
ncbi:MAG: nucleotide pyrophosphohydrolase [Trueperaceae bacterium]|nr:nucleotide pyrophosphohydrolase [Trueperaceae bacterium]